MFKIGQIVKIKNQKTDWYNTGKYTIVNIDENNLLTLNKRISIDYDEKIHSDHMTLDIKELRKQKLSEIFKLYNIKIYNNENKYI